MAQYQLIHGDALTELRKMESNSVDAIVCDPPAGINFMQAKFDIDRGGRTQWVAWLAEIMREAKRVIKPGGHGLIWALPKTAHWTSCALEDAGWEIREKIYHLFGQGFPKSKSMRDIGRHELGSALKPAVEEWILCRKPLSEPSIAANVLRWNCGGLNIGASRVGGETVTTHSRGINTAFPKRPGETTVEQSGRVQRQDGVDMTERNGRFPSHLLLSHHPACVRRGEKRVKGDKRGAGSGIVNYGEANRHDKYGSHDRDGKMTPAYGDADGRELVADYICADGCPVAALDAQAGVRKSGARQPTGRRINGTHPYGFKGDGYCDASEGTVSRFFTVFPPSPFEPDPDALFVYAPKASRSDRNSQGAVNNTHPTCKPTALGRWLSRLICPPGGTLLDPFAGSGSLGVAAVLEGYTWIGIDENAAYIEIARARLAWAEAQRPTTEQLRINL